MREYGKMRRARSNVREKEFALRTERLELINNIKLESGCVDCGYAGHPSALEFDHIRGEKLFNVSQGLARHPDKIMAEIAKCEVVCANCHRIRTTERQRALTKKAPNE